jgi:hypothetical protein
MQTAISERTNDGIQLIHLPRPRTRTQPTGHVVGAAPGGVERRTLGLGTRPCQLPLNRSIRQFVPSIVEIGTLFVIEKPP